MKILYIANICNRIGSFSYTAMEAAKKLGMEFHIAANFTDYRKDDSLRKEDEKNNGIVIHIVDFIRAPYDLRNIKAYRQIVGIIEKEGIDIIHCNTPIGGVVGRLAGKRCKVNTIIYQVHGFHFYKGAPLVNWLIYYPIERLLARYTDCLITINREDYLRASNFHLRNSGKAVYVPGVGINLSEYTNLADYRDSKRLELGLEQDDCGIISVGELNTNKNNSVIIVALGIINNPHIHYYLCGVGPERNKLEALAKDVGVYDNIHFLGYRNDIKELYSATDIFVMPSFREGLSRSIMEAMAAGLPCVVSRIRGNTDLITQEEFLCDSKDSKQFAYAIKRLVIDNELRLKVGCQNAERVASYSIEKVEEQIRRIYSEIISNKVS